MTESEWVACTDPEAMLNFLGEGDARKLRLFACACYREVWPHLDANLSQRAVESAERFADGEATPAALGAPAGEPPRAELPGLRPGAPALREARLAAEASQEVSAWAVPGPAREAAREAARGAQAALLRDVFGNPFRPPAPPLDPFWLAWNDRLIPRLAGAIHEERTFDAMPILGDALEDAGCDRADVLDHCRAPGPHARGCWVLALLLDGDGGVGS